MKDPADTCTLDAFPQPRRPGRPKTGNAKSGAERQAAYRQRQASKPSREQQLEAVLRDFLAELDRDTLDSFARKYLPDDCYVGIYIPGRLLRRADALVSFGLPFVPAPARGPGREAP